MFLVHVGKYTIFGAYAWVRMLKTIREEQLWSFSLAMLNMPRWFNPYANMPVQKIMDPLKSAIFSHATRQHYVGICQH